ncbi:hypothetical protein F2Q68_00033576 [Brassica cretica]|uniref:Uncharacterized protein n=1 Tax=Brassica cretica TaxID=69181 RepID=A0A8S9GZE0_BRACR|nr:hypothetical protein F2Q68_00033576 [Brassica cretica]
MQSCSYPQQTPTEKPPDWQDFVGIICLLVINSTISFIEENNAGNAAAALMAGLAPKTKILDLANARPDLRKKVFGCMDKYAERGLRSLAVARQVVPEKTKESPGGPWEFVGLLPLFDPPRHDSAETIRRALNLGVNAEKVAIQSDLDSMKEKHRREIEGRDKQARKDCNLARLSLAREYDGVLAVVKNKLEQKKKETAAEIRLQEVRARIEVLTEYHEGGFELEAELERLHDLEISLEVDYGLA